MCREFCHFSTITRLTAGTMVHFPSYGKVAVCMYVKFYYEAVSFHGGQIELLMLCYQYQ